MDDINIIAEYSHLTNGHVRLIDFAEAPGRKYKTLWRRKIEFSHDGVTWGSNSYKSVTTENKSIIKIYFKMVKSLMDGTKIIKYSKDKKFHPFHNVL